MNSRKTAIRTPLTLALALVALVLASRVRAHVPGVVLTGRGTATIDGVLSPGEWVHSASIDFPVNVLDGGSIPGTLFVMNDDTNLYLAVRFGDSGTASPGSAVFEFDNNHDGGDVANGDDILGLNSSGFGDGVRVIGPPCPPETVCGFFDTDVGGSNDGAGVLANDGTFWVYEFSHPLKSADAAHDFQLSPGDTVGFTLFLRFCSGDFCVDTGFPVLCVCPFAYGDIVIAPAVSRNLFLHGGTGIPPGLFLDEGVPTGGIPRTKDSAALQFAGGNPFKEIGSWPAVPPFEGTLAPPVEVRAWVGLKNSDDIGTQLDLRAELYRNGVLVSSGLRRCITGLTRNPDLAREASVVLEPFSPSSFAASDVLSLKVLARIGTRPDDTKCSGPGGSHASATGLRLYFDSTNRPSRLLAH